MSPPTFVFRGRVGALARDGLGSSVVLAGVVAAGLSLLASALGWRGADAPNYLFRIDLFRQAGFTVWNMAWYGGHYTFGYSALLPPLGALMGPVALGVVAAVVAAVCFDRLLGSMAGVSETRRRIATLVFAAGTVTNLAVGRLAFALGLAAALAAVLAGRRDRWRTAAALSVVTTLASPVAGFFLALAWGAVTLARRPWRSAVAPVLCAAGALAPIAISVLFFPEGGSYPFRRSSLFFVLGASALALLLAPARNRVVRNGAILYAVAAVAVYAVATPMGGNIERLGMYVAAPLLIAVTPRRRIVLLLAALPLLMWWQWAPAFDGMFQANADPSSDAAYFRPLTDYLQLQPHVVGRIEIPFTERHYETAYVAPVVPLARGWERQIDISENPLFYEDTLDAAAYDSWLLDNGVEFVALPDASLDFSATREAALIASNPPFLQPVWQSDHWRVWKVVGTPGVVAGPAELSARRADSLVLDASAPGRVTVRVRWTRYWSVKGPACVEEGDDGWTRLEVTAPGRLVLEPALFGPRSHCPS
jgi:hypothetical protein